MTIKANGKAKESPRRAHWLKTWIGNVPKHLKDDLKARRIHRRIAEDQYDSAIGGIDD